MCVCVCVCVCLFLVKGRYVILTTNTGIVSVSPVRRCCRIPRLFFSGEGLKIGEPVLKGLEIVRASFEALDNVEYSFINSNRKIHFDPE